MSEHPLEKPTVSAGMCIRLVNPHPFTWELEFVLLTYFLKNILNRNLSRCTAAPESPTEAFIKRKKAFIEISQRHRGDKGQSSCLWKFSNQNSNGENYRYLLSKELCIYLVVLLSGIMYFTPWLVLHSGSFVSHLKGMSNVKCLSLKIWRLQPPHTHKRTLGYVYGFIYIW